MIQQSLISKVRAIENATNTNKIMNIITVMMAKILTAHLGTSRDAFCTFVNDDDDDDDNDHDYDNNDDDHEDGDDEDDDNVLCQGRNLYGTAVKAGKRDIRMVIYLLIIMMKFSCFCLTPVITSIALIRIILPKVCFAYDLGCEHSFISKSRQLPALIRFFLFHPHFHHHYHSACLMAQNWNNGCLVLCQIYLPHPRRNF